MSATEIPQFSFNLAGRLRNMSLPASATNALVPVYEAISNSIHAVAAKWGDSSAVNGQVDIHIHRLDDKANGTIIGFTIADNGIGLDEKNWTSFCTSDSDHKLDQGGKGVGRLGWLKAFADCRIHSVFSNEGRYCTRAFSFSDDNEDNPFYDYSFNESSAPSSIGTKVILRPFKTNFQIHCPKRTDTIAARIVGHFLTYFMAEQDPNINLIDHFEKISLRAFFAKSLERKSTQKFDISLEDGKLYSFSISHVLLKKALKFHDDGMHWIFFSGNRRVVEQESIDGQIGLKYVGPSNDCVYVGLVNSEFLDTHVNQERTSFTCDKQILTAIHKESVRFSRDFLSEYIAKIRNRQIEVSIKIIRENPQFLSFREDIQAFVENNLTLTAQSEEEIFLELSRRKLRGRRALAGQLNRMKQSGAAALSEEVTRITNALNDEKKNSLAEYVVRRKSLLDLFDNSLAFPIHKKENIIKKKWSMISSCL
jgi:hypothetical protein